MAAMSRNDLSASQGFYVFQSALGAPLQFHPALGTPELDDMMHAYLPGNSSVQDKRAAVSVDFFESVQLTGQTVKFYSVPSFSHSYTSTASSPASTQDSGYGSNYVSPMTPTWSWPQNAPTPTPSLTSRSSRRTHHSSRSSASRQRPNDFSHLPGMKILTRDGRDVTDAAARGCKTKEQRDHAHLMRTIKACDACRRKKVRCDPSHKTRLASSLDSLPRRTTRQKEVIPESRSEPAAQEELFIGAATPSEFDLQANLNPYATTADMTWDDFIQYDREPDRHSVPIDYDFFVDPNGYFSSSPESADSGTSPSQPFTPSSQVIGNAATVASGCDATALQPPMLPYEDHSAPAHHYIDFNLYSPTPSVMDEEEDMVLIGDRPQRNKSIPGLENLVRERSGHCPNGAVSDLLDQQQYCPTVVPGHIADAHSLGHAINCRDYHAAPDVSSWCEHRSTVTSTQASTSSTPDILTATLSSMEDLGHSVTQSQQSIPSQLPDIRTSGQDEAVDSMFESVIVRLSGGSQQKKRRRSVSSQVEQWRTAIAPPAQQTLGTSNGISCVASSSLRESLPDATSTSTHSTFAQETRLTTIERPNTFGFVLTGIEILLVIANRNRFEGNTRSTIRSTSALATIGQTLQSLLAIAVGCLVLAGMFGSLLLPSGNGSCGGFSSELPNSLPGIVACFVLLSLSRHSKGPLASLDLGTVEKLPTAAMDFAKDRIASIRGLTNAVRCRGSRPQRSFSSLSRDS